MRTFYKLTILLILLWGLWWTPAEADRVMVVHSYHEGYEWTKSINESLESSFNVHGIAYRIFYMDTKRQPGETWKRAMARKAKKAVAQYDPQVVIAVDDNAQAYFVKDYVNKSPIQFVFCGVNADPERYGYPATNVTGILERAYHSQTLRTLKAIMPQVRRVAVVSDDSATTNLLLPRIHKLPSQASTEPGIVITHYAQPATFSQWQHTIQQLEKDVQVDALMIPLFHTVKKESTQVSMASSEVLAWTIKNSTKPLVGLWPIFVNGGGLLAVTVSPHEHGRVAAQMALEILDGKSSNQIPIQINQDGHVMFNMKNKGHLAFDASINIDQIADIVIR